MSLRIFLRRSISLGQARQALGIEGVRRVEELHVGLVGAGERHRLQLEAVLQQVLGDRLLHAPHIVAALLVHLLHRDLGGDRAQHVDELALEQLAQRLRLHGALAQRLRRVGDRFGSDCTRT